MYRRAIQTLFVAATALLLTTTACDKGDDKKADDKKADENKAPEEVEAEAGEPAAEAGAENSSAGAEAGAAAAAEAGAEAGEVAAEAGAGEAGEAVPAAGEGSFDGDAGGDEKADDGDDKPDDGDKKPAGGDKTAAGPKIDGKPIFEKKCKSCHGIDGKGETTIGKKVGIPSLVKTKLSKGKIVSTIEKGVPDTKMKGYKDKLSKEEIDAVAAYVKKL